MRSRVVSGLAFIAIVAAALGGFLVWHRAHSRWSAGDAAARLVAMVSPHDDALRRVENAISGNDAEAFAISCTDLASTDLDLAGRVDHGRWPSSATYAAGQFSRALRAQAADLDGCASRGQSGMTDTNGPEAALESDLGNPPPQSAQLLL